MTRSTIRVAILLFFSGACALVYQTSWMRQFRVIFGTSTYATGAVLALFMAGLGIGSTLLGRRADRSEKPLAFYGRLEVVIALSAAVTPLILELVRMAYVATGGATSMGLGVATMVRLALGALVLAIPTIAMGGTLPAAARAVESNDDDGRKRLALLYGANTLGAVSGTLLSTFVLLERFGNRNTLLAAVVVNVIVGIVAIVMAQRVEPDVQVEEETKPRTSPVLLAAGAVGFAFLLMELVWYRMLSPLLGGTTFMFGLILAIALAGIGLGGAAYSLFSRGAATPGGFALTCTLEALAVAIPFAMGDRLALVTLLLRPRDALGFGGHVLAWTIVTAIVVLPAAFISGVQFPMLISLLGRGRTRVGREVGLAYAWNTAGAIAGSLLGGFGLLPLLSAPGCWKLVIYLLTLLGLFAVLHALREGQRIAALSAVAAAVLALSATFALGPTAPWRHSGIGAGRALPPANANAAREWMHRERRTQVLDADGRESSIGLFADRDLSLIVNGKSDGTARADAGTQVMSGMLPALLSRNPRTCAVIGLGTGTTAGWLASIPSMQKVDVIELEPIVVEAAEAYAPVTRDALRNPKVKMTLGDAREVLVTTRERYDIIFSEPSNPYRAGIASLYTREFYRAAAKRLNGGGIFAQWMQTYAADAQTIRTVYATLGTVFPHIETWWTTGGDLLLVATRAPVTHDVAALRAKLATEPYRGAAHVAWRVETLEGVLAHFVASDGVAKRIARGAPLNTDDRTVIEFSFARALSGGSFSTRTLIDAAKRVDGGRPARVRGAIDWQLVDANRAVFFDGRRTTAPVNSQELALVTAALAQQGRLDTLNFANRLGVFQPIERDIVVARMFFQRGRTQDAASVLHRALTQFRGNPWPLPAITRVGIETAQALATRPESAAQIADALSQPFAAAQWNDARRVIRATALATAEGCSANTIAALRELEPHPPWNAEMLRLRARCHRGDERAAAERDLRDYLAAEPPRLLQ